MVQRQTLIIAGAVALAAVAVIYMVKKATDAAQSIGESASAALEAVTSGQLVTAAGDAVAANVKAAGAQVGIPDTNMNECQRAMAEGRTWDASFACPAPVFLRYLANGAKPPDAGDPGASVTPAHGG